MKALLQEINKCAICKGSLPHEPRPVVRASVHSRILVIGQAPGRRVHESGVPWDDPSGNNLRDWMGVTKDQFYDENLFALIPMGFCYPGTGKTGDLAPRKECAPLWHKSLIDTMPDLRLTLLIGNYAQKYYLGKSAKKTLTETVWNYNEYLPEFMPLPHPSPRNNIWQHKHKWFKEEVVPVLGALVESVLKG